MTQNLTWQTTKSACRLQRLASEERCGGLGLHHAEARLRRRRRSDNGNNDALLDKEDSDKYYEHGLGQRLGRAGRRHFPIPYPRVGKRTLALDDDDDIIYYANNAAPVVVGDIPWNLIPRARLGKKSAAPNMIPMARLGKRGGDSYAERILGKREPMMIPMARLG